MGEKNHARCTPEECWDFIYEDLTFAAKYLPKRWDDATKDPWGEATHTGRVTQGAAWECWLVPCFMRNVGKMHPMLLWK